jgi:DNA polymerase-3 subunit alpha
MPYWRFIHKDRPELPDIDIDTEGSKRTRVFNKVKEYFNSIGGDVINVCTFGTEKSKSAIRTAGRALNVDDDIISFIV